jgi:hypothetical protein
MDILIHMLYGKVYERQAPEDLVSHEIVMKMLSRAYDMV